MSWFLLFTLEPNTEARSISAADGPSASVRRCPVIARSRIVEMSGVENVIVSNRIAKLVGDPRGKSRARAAKSLRVFDLWPPIQL